MGQNKNINNTTSSKKRIYTEKQRREIARRRAARRRKVYFYRMLFFLVLLVIILSMIKVVSTLISGNSIQTWGNAKDIDDEIIENNEESIDSSAYDFIVCLDPGHGFDDEGCRSQSVKGAIERDIVFDLALRVKELLMKNNIGVILTHTTNKTPSDYEGSQYVFGIDKRVEYANSLDIDFYVSIHCDYYEKDSSIRGTKIYYLENTSSPMEEIAQSFSTAIFSSVKASTPALMPMSYEDAYYVLKYTKVPAVLVETGFLSNKKEAKEMLTKSWKKKMAEGLADSIIAVYNQNFK